MITPRYFQPAPNTDRRSAGYNNTLLTTGPMGIPVQTRSEHKINETGRMFHFPHGVPSLSFSLSLSPSHTPLCYLYLSPRWPLSSDIPELRRYTTQKRTQTHRSLKNTERKGESTYKREKTHTHTHAGVYIQTQ